MPIGATEEELQSVSKCTTGLVFFKCYRVPGALFDLCCTFSHSAAQDENCLASALPVVCFSRLNFVSFDTQKIIWSLIILRVGLTVSWFKPHSTMVYGYHFPESVTFEEQSVECTQCWQSTIIRLVKHDREKSEPHHYLSFIALSCLLERLFPETSSNWFKLI